MREAQVLFVDFQQLPRQTQTCQMPVRALAAGHHDHQPGRQMIEKELQAAIKYRPLGQMIIIEHQQQRLAQHQVHGQFVEQTVEPLLEGKRLVALAHLQQAHRLRAQLREELLKADQQTLEKTARVAVPRAQPQPYVLPVVRQPLTELDGQRTLAEPGRGADQQQSAAQPCIETLTQARTGNITLRERWTEKSPFQRRNRAVCKPLHSGQISHGRLVWESLFRHRGVRRLAGKSLLLKGHHRKDCNKIPTAYKAASHT